MKLRHYQEPIAWQKSMDFAVSVYDVTRSFPCDEVFGLTAQLRRAAISIPSNIAEGQGRATPGEFVQSLGHATASLQESETQLLLAHRLNYVDVLCMQQLMARSEEISRIIAGLNASIQRKRR
jgi:four helix bundle protein